MLKRVMDFLLALIGLLVASPILLPSMLLVFLQDFHSPFYIAPRVGRDEKLFSMVKLRSMIVNADKSGVDSTSNNDKRITAVGHFIRRFKLDELMQLWNVLLGDMSLVGPRPNVKVETDLYTREEKKLLSVKPGITDISSIVFSDEGDILEEKDDPDLAYNQLIRPWKSRLGLIYIERRSTWLDLKLIFLTVIAVIDKQRALRGIAKILRGLDASEKLIDVCRRDKELLPAPPPGSDEVVTSR